MKLNSYANQNQTTEKLYSRVFASIFLLSIHMLPQGRYQKILAWRGDSTQDPLI